MAETPREKYLRQKAEIEKQQADESREVIESESAPAVVGEQPKAPRKPRTKS